MRSLHFPLRTAIAGIGGFGTQHHGVFAQLEEDGLVRVVATCDPALDRLEEVCKRHRFAGRGVRAYRDFDEMLHACGAQLDLGVVAAPISLHARMHEAFVRNGAACYLEKPPTLDPEELRGMLAVEEHAAVPTNVGFSYIYMPERLALKRRMLGGEFGALKGLSFLGLAQRDPFYFQRNNWAGKLLFGGHLLLDSCLGNAMAHFVNSMLFFANQSLLQGWSRPISMDCELYRANPIEGPDTIFAIAGLDNGIELRIAASHACPNREQVIEEKMEFEGTTITIRATNIVTIERPGMPDETFSIAEPSLADCVGDYMEFLNGHHARPAQTLHDCLGFVETNALFYLADSQIHDLPANALSHLEPDSVIAMPNVEDAGRRLIDEVLLPSQAGFSWARPGGTSSIDAVPNLRALVQRIQCALG